MSTLVWPTFPGQSLDVKRTGPHYEVQIETSRSGKETRTGLWSTPLYRWAINLEFARNGPTSQQVTVYNTGGSAKFTGTETEALLWLITQVQGQWDYFYLADPYLVQPAYYQVGGTPIGPPAPLSCTLGSGTLAAGSYYYMLTSLGVTGESVQSFEQTFGLGSPGGINVNWTPVAGATGYKIYRYGPASSSPGNLETYLATVSGGSSTYLDSGSVQPSGLPLPLVRVRFDMDNEELSQMADFARAWSASVKLVTVK